MSIAGAGTPPRFVTGSVARHVVVMALTGSLGLVAVFAVDFLSLLYVSRLGDQRLTAGVGFATQILFFVFAISIGMTIGITALVSRALGAGDRPRAIRHASTGLVQIGLVSAATVALVWPWRTEVLTILNARGEALDVASGFLAITLPANILLGVGMALAGILRAVGDARRAMYVTLAGAFVTAIIDPILIFGLGLGVTGAALTTVVSRVVIVAVGLHGAVRVHGLVGRTTPAAVLGDVWPLMIIAGPAILTNLAAPVANGYAIRIFARFGEGIVAGMALIDRITPVAFGVLFALTGAVGPIIGQNVGAVRFDRVRATLVTCFVFVTLYVSAIWFLLWLGSPVLVRLFGAHGDTAEIVVFFCTYAAAAWLFLGFLFVAVASFNNLGYPVLSAVFAWARATLGTIPFVTWGAAHWGPEGGLAGIVAGAAIFGILALVVSFRITGRLSRASPRPLAA